MATGKKHCSGCGNNEAWIVHNKKERLSGNTYQECNKCFDPSLPSVLDVYFKEPYWDFNLHDQDDPNYDPKRGTFIKSRSHKAYVLKKLHLREAGDKEHGSRNHDAKLEAQWKF